MKIDKTVITMASAITFLYILFIIFLVKPVAAIDPLYNKYSHFLSAQDNFPTIDQLEWYKKEEMRIREMYYSKRTYQCLLNDSCRKYLNQSINDYIHGLTEELIKEYGI